MLELLHPLLQIVEVQRAAVIGPEGVFDLRRRQILELRRQHHAAEGREGLHLHDHPHTQWAVLRGDSNIGEPTRRLHRIEIALQFGAGDASAGTHLHRLIGLQLQAFFLRMLAETEDHHFGDQHPWLLDHHRFLNLHGGDWLLGDRRGLLNRCFLGLQGRR